MFSNGSDVMPYATAMTQVKLPQPFKMHRPRCLRVTIGSTIQAHLEDNMNLKLRAKHYQTMTPYGSAWAINPFEGSFSPGLVGGCDMQTALSALRTNLQRAAPIRSELSVASERAALQSVVPTSDYLKGLG